MMTTVWMDPAELRPACTTIAQQSVRLRDAALSLYSSCTCSMPPAIAGTVAAEVEAITIEILRAAIVYLEQVIDTWKRADEITGDQSVASAVSAPATMTIGGNAFGSALVGGGSSGGAAVMTIGGTSRESFLANNPLLAAAENLRNRNPAAAAQLSGLHTFIQDSNNRTIGMWTNSRPGATYIGDGLYSGGGRIGSNIYRRPGEYEYDVY